MGNRIIPNGKNTIELLSGPVGFGRSFVSNGKLLISGKAIVKVALFKV